MSAHPEDLRKKTYRRGGDDGVTSRGPVATRQQLDDEVRRANISLAQACIRVVVDTQAEQPGAEPGIEDVEAPRNAGVDTDGRSDVKALSEHVRKATAFKGRVGNQAPGGVLGGRGP